MIVIRCPECQEKILLIPDERAMGKAIHDHVKKHLGLSKQHQKDLELEIIVQCCSVIVAKYYLEKKADG